MKRDLPADGLRVLGPVGGHLPVVDTERESGDPLPLLAKQADHVLLPFPDVPDGVDPGGVELFSRRGPHGIQDAHVPVQDQIDKILRGGDLKVPVRLFLLAGGLCRRFGIGDANGAGQSQFLPDPALDGPGDLPGAGKIPGGLCYVQIRLVESDGLRGGGIAVPDPVELTGHLSVFFHIRVHVNAVGAKPIRLFDVHGRVYAVFARLVAARGDDAPLARQGADDQGLAPQGGVVPDLHRGKESVHIHVNDDLIHLPALRCLEF